MGLGNDLESWLQQFLRSFWTGTAILGKTKQNKTPTKLKKKKNTSISFEDILVAALGVCDELRAMALL